MTGTGMSPRKVSVLSISDVLHLEKGSPVPCSIKFLACESLKGGEHKKNVFETINVSNHTSPIQI